MERAAPKVTRGALAVLIFWGWIGIGLVLGFTLFWNAAIMWWFGSFIVAMLSIIVYGVVENDI